MGRFDTIRMGDLEGQVKCWHNNLVEYTRGDIVPSISGAASYSVAMRVGGYVNVCENVIVHWTEQPYFLLIFDKYGDLHRPDQDAEGVFGDPYLFGDKVVNPKTFLKATHNED